MELVCLGESSFAMEKKSLLILSLEEMALRKLVVHHWSQNEILVLVAEFPFKQKRLKTGLWRETVECEVIDQISELIIPEPLKRRMIEIVRPIGLQIPEWEIFMARCLCDSRMNLDVNILKQLCWTSAGALDYAKTAVNLVNLETLDVLTRFEIACGHCLVDWLPVVWEKLSEEYKIGFTERLLNTRLDLLKEKFLQIYWFSVLGGEYELLQRREDFYCMAFKYSVRSGNKAATEYFFQKLDNDVRGSALEIAFSAELRRVLVHVALLDLPLERNPDILCYLLFQMAPEVQLRVLRENPGIFFRVFLHWPWQDLFLDNARLLWDCPPEEYPYRHLIFHIRMKIEYSDYYFPELFREFFRKSPDEFREHFVNEESTGYGPPLFSGFLMNEDIKTVRTILNNLKDEDRFRLLSVPDVFRGLNFHLGQTDIVEFCVRAACPSRKDRRRLKGTYMRLLRRQGRNEVMKSKWQWQQFFKSLDDADDSCKKARVVEQTSRNL